jgi:probable F420-dependent oxidoreductase
MRVAVSIPVEEGLPVSRLVEFGTTAEACGYDAVVAGEVAGPDAIGLLSVVASRTERVRILTGVLPMGTRSPALMAMGFQTLDSLAPGRILAGVGVSSPIVIERWHGLTFHPPLAYAREFLPAFRSALDGERLQLEGPYLRSDGFKTTLPQQHRIPIVLAAMRPKMIRLAGELTDGAFLTWCPPVEAAEQATSCREAATQAGKDPASLHMMASFFGYAGPDLDEARERMRRYVLQYAMVPTHRDSFARAIPNLPQIEEAWRAGDRSLALSLVSDASVDQMAAIGEDAVVRRVHELNEAGIDLPIMVTVAARFGDGDGPLATIKAAAGALGLGR